MVVSITVIKWNWTQEVNICLWDSLCVYKRSVFFLLSDSGKCHNDTSNYIICCLFSFLYLTEIHFWLLMSPCSPWSRYSEKSYVPSPLTPSYLKANQLDTCNLTGLALKRDTSYLLHFIRYNLFSLKGCTKLV